MGFHSYWLPENNFSGQRAIPSPLTLLAAVAAKTQTLKLATTSYLLPIRHPLQAAEEVAVLDQLCNGRLILGLGRGIQKDLFAAFDIDPREKRDLFASKLALMRSAWAGEAIGNVDDDRPTYLAPLPVQRPHPPLWVAAFGPLALKQVGALGLPYIASPIETLEALTENYAQHAEAASAAGLTVPVERPVMRTVFISDRPGLCTVIKQSLAQAMPAKMQKPGVEVDDWAIIGSKREVEDKLALYKERLGITLLIAGGRLPSMDETDLRASLESCAALEIR